MAKWSNKLVIYQINTWVWLTTLSQQYAKDISLNNIPDSTLDELASTGFDMIWLMGVWKRSPKGRSLALNYKHEYVGALPDVSDDDIIGSAYAVGEYTVDARIGGRKGLAALRERMKQRGLLLMLDFVPNHVGIDHAWVYEHPDYIVQGTPSDIKQRRSDFFRTRRGSVTRILAHGRDPYFPGWSDTAQLNVFNPELRKAMAATLLDIANQCDGVRCDMAMLLLNEIFARTWHGFVGETPKQEFWREIIPQVKAHYPDFLFAAEVYWDKEYEIIQQGFDFAYDKTLYDRIVEATDIGGVQKVRQHLVAPIEYQQHLVRFVENHDEPRAYSRLGKERSFPAAALICTLPGATLLHDGQFHGRTRKLPVQIKRQTDEPRNAELEAYYKRLLREVRDPIYQNGDWYLFHLRPIAEGNYSHENLLAYGWYERGKDYRLVVINLTQYPAQGRVDLSAWQWLEGSAWKLYDVTDDAEYERAGGMMTKEGLTILLDGYESHVFRFESAASRANGRKRGSRSTKRDPAEQRIAAD